MLLLAGHAAFHTPISGFGKNGQGISLPVFETAKEAVAITKGA